MDCFLFAIWFVAGAVAWATLGEWAIRSIAHYLAGHHHG